MSDDDVHEALSAQLERLTGNDRFLVAEFGPEDVTVWRIYRDKNGTPQAERPKPIRASVMADPDAFYREVAPVLAVRTSTTLPDKVRALLPGSRDVRLFDADSSLAALVKAAIKESPLQLGYELAVLKQVPTGQSGAGRLYPDGQLLFQSGVKQGHQAKIRVHCEPTDSDGTVFAVVTREPGRDLPLASRRLQPVQLLSAVVDPGRYDLTAVLERPGRVHFDGLPTPLTEPARSWDDLLRLIPDRLAPSDQIHLVCLLEVTGGDERLRSRVERLQHLIRVAGASARQLLVSVVAYGAHAVAWGQKEEPISFPAWTAPSAVAIAALGGLLPRRVDEREYPRAAQLECALETAARGLANRDGRTVIVTAGGRPPHPHEMDINSQIIPCPDRVNYRSQFRRLDVPGTTFGVFCDPGSRLECWQELGRDGLVTVNSAFDMKSFAAGLGLRETAQTVPFPFIG